MSTTSVLRSSAHFWQSFLQPLSYTKQAIQTSGEQPHDVMRARAIETWHHQTLAQASVLEVLTMEAYITMGKVSQQPDGPEKAMAALCANDGMLLFISIYLSLSIYLSI